LLIGHSYFGGLTFCSNGDRNEFITISESAIWRSNITAVLLHHYRKTLLLYSDLLWNLNSSCYCIVELSKTKLLISVWLHLIAIVCFIFIVKLLNNYYHGTYEIYRYNWNVYYNNMYIINSNLWNSVTISYELQSKLYFHLIPLYYFKIRTPVYERILFH
jgi:hypothetical protein